MPESVQDRPTRAHEQVFLFAKQGKYYYDGEGVREPQTEPWRGKGEQETTSPKNLLTPGLSASSQAWGIRQYNPNGRACRSVWSLASEPSGFQHYAAFPQALVRRCLLAGAPSQVCSKCHAPYRRVVETIGMQRMRWAPGVDQYHTQAKGAHGATSSFSTGDVAIKHTTGDEPTCACAAGIGKAVILDPFCGSGTTLLVARELGHHAVGIDLSYPYLSTIARERLGLADLARWEGRNGHHAPAVTLDGLPLFGGTP